MQKFLFISLIKNRIDLNGSLDLMLINTNLSLIRFFNTVMFRRYKIILFCVECKVGCNYGPIITNMANCVNQKVELLLINDEK